MAAASIPVDLFNPGQVFACMGFLEATETLLGDAECRFDWSEEADVRFHLQAAGNKNPFEVVVEFFADAELRRTAPIGYEEKYEADDDEAGQNDEGEKAPTHLSQTFPAAKGDRMALPIRLCGARGPIIEIGHWADGSGRDALKLYSGNRSAFGIARAMLTGSHEKPRKGQASGDLKTKGIVQLWEEQREGMIARPFDVLTPIGGRFNFDPRGAWTAIDAGYSPDKQEHQVAASPLVELLAALGLENMRPVAYERRKLRYAVWAIALAPMLARIALPGGIPSLPHRCFRFGLAMSGKNKVVTFAQEDPLQ